MTLLVIELLDKKERWARGACAFKGSVAALATDQCDKYDILGAIIHCYGFNGISEPYNKIRLRVGRSPVAWNDDPTTTFTMLRKIIKECGI